jgi:hypothetical protein
MCLDPELHQKLLLLDKTAILGQLLAPYPYYCIAPCPCRWQLPGLQAKGKTTTMKNTPYLLVIPIAMAMAMRQQYNYNYNSTYANNPMVGFQGFLGLVATGHHHQASMCSKNTSSNPSDIQLQCRFLLLFIINLLIKGTR